MLSSKLTPIVLAGLLLAGGPPPRPPSPPPKDAKESARGQTVVLGTHFWQIGGAQPGKGRADFWWEIINAKDRCLVPQGGAAASVVAGKRFEELTRADLAKLTYAGNKIPGAALVPGTVVAVRTTQGNYAKLKVVRYHDSHDVAFQEIGTANPAWVLLLLRRPKMENYHLEVEWVLYRR